MIEANSLLVHIDLKNDREAGVDLEFDGWVASDQPVRAVWLSGAPGRCLATCDRPDVRRVFPGRLAIGFSGRASERELTPTGLPLVIQLNDGTQEVVHPLPPALARLPLIERLSLGLHLYSLGWRTRLVTNPTRRWKFTLQRHLLERRRRAGVFQRRHTEALLMDFARVVPDAVFLQIGANDGYTGDPINPLLAHARNWRGLLVEPVPHLFAQLQARYANYPALRLEQAAICEHDGTTTIHRLQTQPDDSLWIDQLPSLERALLERNAGPFHPSNDTVIAEAVRAMTVPTLLSRHQLTHLDLLVIDTEGWDWRILRQFDLTRLHPKLILYEHQHLRPDEREEAHQFLAGLDYDWVETNEGDSLAWRMA